MPSRCPICGVEHETLEELQAKEVKPKYKPKKTLKEPPAWDEE